MRQGSEEYYQIATLVVLTLAVLSAICIVLIFVNPRIAFNPFKPPRTTAPIAVIQTLPPTWTPSPTDKPIAATQTLPPTWTPSPTDRPISTATSKPSSTPTTVPSPTSLPTPTSPPPSPTSTSRPPTPQVSTPPTPIPSGYSFRPVLQSCTHSGSTTIKGKVTSGGQPVDGARIRLATGPDASNVVEDQLVRRDVDGSTVYAFSLPPGTFSWFVWTVDAAGAPLSSPNFRVEINNLPASNPEACWQAVVNFVK